jgi:hypothetical protein
VNEIEPPKDFRLRRVLRTEDPAPSDARLRVRARLEAAVAAMSGAPTEPGARATPSGWGGRGTLALTAFLLGGASGAGLLSALAGRADQRAVPVERPALRAAIAETQMPRPPDPSKSVGTIEPGPPRAPPSGPPQGSDVSVRSVSPRPSKLSAERRLLDEARASLVQGSAAHAIDVLEQHRAHFPQGILAEERDAMEVEALVGAGRYVEARNRALEFRARAPSSIFRATVDSAVASIP